ncbi:MAG: glycosyltransferase family 39 protein [Gallionellaceae bacterium]|jgi:4-amino-4-deoxy-L-arabinose transferase-like glycosyltransferase|nr:glycosyltransferase family 39 protein [Gallionellaceae bacterium]
MLPLSPDQEYVVTRAKAFLLALLCAIWACTGLVGHDPWRPGDAYSFGIIHHILQSGDWLIPQIAGESDLKNPPLFFQTGALFAQLFSPWLSPHDGARLASGFYTGLTLLFVGLAGRELFGKGRGWPTVIILIGCLGMLVNTHLMLTDLALLAGCAMMQYGFCLSQRRPLAAGLLIGTGVGVGFMAKSFTAPMLFLLIAVAMLIFRNWRVRPYYTSLGIAALAALPWLVIWPTLLYLHSPQAFMEWIWGDNIGRWLEHVRSGDFEDVFYYLGILPWFAWPALPLAAWAVWRNRGKVWHTIEFQLPLTSFLVTLIALSLATSVNNVFALPLLLPLALLATAALPILRRGAANALDWFGIMTFGVIGILMWWGWAGLLLDNHAKITQLLKAYQPGFEPTVYAPTFWIALFATLLWIVMVWRVGRSMRRAVVNWAGGVTLVWILAMTIWLPWLDSSKSYRDTALSLKHELPARYNCITSQNVGATQRAMLGYHAGITIQSGAARDCGLMLVLDSGLSKTPVSRKKWQQIWKGSRPSDRDEVFRLYRKVL